jgi:hypothetical protein
LTATLGYDYVRPAPVGACAIETRKDRIMSRGMGLAAFVAGLAFVALPAAAAEFAETCVEGGGGMFEKKECSCLDDKVSDDERDALLVMFKANLKAIDKGKTPDDSTPEFQNAMAVLNKYMDRCSK